MEGFIYCMKNILIIEDDSALTTGLCRALSSGEIHTAGCHCLREARIMLQQEVYALILLDVNLPDGNGFDFLKEIKSRFSIPVILLTANDMETDIVAGLELGAASNMRQHGTYTRRHAESPVHPTAAACSRNKLLSLITMPIRQSLGSSG